MKQFIGFIIIILAIPILFIVQGEIATELSEASSINNQIKDSIDLKSPTYDIPVVMKDYNGFIFAEEYVEWRTPLSLSEIPMIARQLFLDSEDNEFYNHRGFDIAAIVRAFLVNTKTDDLRQGGSTITQQLVRMRSLSPEKTYERKLTELFYAAELEKQLTKDDILEMYLNEMYFANRVYGIGSAATYYFNRPIADLNLAEIAFIAAIPNNPTLYDPLVNFELTKKRQERLLDTLVQHKRISLEEANQYKKTAIELTLKTKANNSPAYSGYVLRELEELIGASEGYSKRIHNAKDKDSKNALLAELKERTNVVLSSGIIIETAHDPFKQERDDRALNDLVPGNLQAGAVVIDNKNREIVSIYGGNEYAKNDFNRAYQAVRQPGSAIKPLLVYAPLFESKNYTENTPVNSGPICIGTYCPENVGKHVYGTTSIKEAFRHSHNTTAVRLLQSIGIDEAFNYLEPFNFNSLSKIDRDYSAALGGTTNGVTPLELAEAFTGFIDGEFTPVRTIRSVIDQEGNILYEWEKQMTEVWSPPTVSTIRNLLQDVVKNGTGRGIPTTTTYTGVKTGTTDYYRDLWAAGLNDHYTTAVWIGYDKPESLQKFSNQKLHLKAFSVLMQQ